VNPVLQAARDARAQAQEKLDALLVAPTAEARALEDTEATEFEALSAEIDKLDKQIDGLVAAEKRTEAAALASLKLGSPAVVTSEAMTYDKFGRDSYFRDMAALAVSARRIGGMETDPYAALERLQRHNAEVEAAARNDKDVAARLREIRMTPAALLEQRTNPNTTDGTGGEFVPPLWLVAQYIPYMRPGRVFANRVRSFPLPPGTDTINLPKITTGSLTGIQSSQGGAVTSQDMVTGSVSATVNTIAGQEDISLQLLEQSPISMDGVVFEDLSRDYDLQLDKQVTYGSGASGQHKGVLTLTGATTNTDRAKASEISSTATNLVDATASNSSQFKNVVNGVNQVETLRFESPTAIWVHPRRANYWGAFPSATDGRPVYIAARYAPQNAVGLNEPGVPQGVAGEMYGLPVVKDANMLAVANGFSAGLLVQTGSTQDPVVVVKEDDLYLWEGALRLRALPEILSGTLQIRFQLYAYSAFMPDRFPASVSMIAGSGYAAPSF
jgi:HK97 family phage major capsid protein